jgi:hypothetical protein
VNLNHKVIDEYSQLMKEGHKFPPVLAVFDSLGVLWIPVGRPKGRCEACARCE